MAAANNARSTMLDAASSTLFSGEFGKASTLSVPTGWDREIWAAITICRVVL